MEVYLDILNGKKKLSVLGLGYVGLPIAIAFAKKLPGVIGYDVNNYKIQTYKNGTDPTNEIGDEAIRGTAIEFTSDESRLKEAYFHIVAVPTPINTDKTPDLFPVENASVSVGRNLRKGAYVVYESTVYPGVTEDICIPILEKESGLKAGKDFKVGYSPERINPGDKIHTLENIVKIVSGIDEDALHQIAKVYEIIIKAGVYPVSCMKAAEAAKVVENSQRDINIAFMNELAMVFERMGIDTNEVINAMNTKWNALGFRPGLVGGHCIGVDPYYFIYEAEKLGYHSQIISAGRKINDDMGAFIGEIIVKQLIKQEINVKRAKVVILGITFKENCPDIRNSKVIDIIKKLAEYEVVPVIVDSWADKEEIVREYGIQLQDIEKIRDVDCIIFAVAHDEYKRTSIELIHQLFRKEDNSKKVIIDIKGICDKKKLQALGYSYWCL
jgi:UDP-N-acetyl-D-galactosamine dehydrogenase